MGEEAPAYLVFGSLLIPTLEAALERRDLRTILTICAYLEDASESAGTDSRLHDLIRIEIGEWLGAAANEEVLSPWLGAETLGPVILGNRFVRRRRPPPRGRKNRAMNFKYILPGKHYFLAI